LSIVVSTYSAAFTTSELRLAFPRPIAILYRLNVPVNGLYFHRTGKLIRFSSTRIESFQTKSAMKRPLEQQGFSDIRFRRVGRRNVVEAKKEILSFATPNVA
jgi:hypothetical protein